MTRINQAILVVGLALGLLLAYRAWLIKAEIQDLEMFAAQGDRIVQIADEGWAGGFGSVNVICREGKPHHLVVSWRMPCHSEPGECNYPATIDASWPTSGTTKDPAKKSAGSATGTSVHFESSDDEVTLPTISLSNMAIAKRRHGEILVSKRLSESTATAFGDQIGKSTAKLRININQQSEWFYLNERADTPQRFTQVCKGS